MVLTRLFHKLQIPGFFKLRLNIAQANPYIVGTHWFQLAEQVVAGRPDGENYQAGFLTVGDVSQPEISRAARELGQRMYSLRSGGTGNSPLSKMQ